MMNRPPAPVTGAHADAGACPYNPCHWAHGPRRGSPRDPGSVVRRPPATRRGLLGKE